MTDLIQFRSLIPGFYPNVSDAEYFRLTAARHRIASNSGMAPLAKSIDHFALSLVDEVKTTPAMMFGTGYHHLILEPETFDEHVGTTPQCIGVKASGAPCTNNATGLVGGAPYCGVHAKGAHGPHEPFTATTISKGDYDNMMNMRDVLLAHPVASLLLEGTIQEGVVLWEDEELGVTFKGKIDHWSALFDDTIVDLKTTIDASPEGFSSTFFKRNYYTQAPMYLDGMNAVGKEVKNFTIIAQEKTDPWPVAVYRVSNDDIELGRLEYRRRAKLFRNYFDNPPTRPTGYGDVIMPLSIPGWAKHQLED